MARKKEPMEFSGALEVQAQKPLDGRRRVSFIADLTDAKSYPYIFKGLDVFCEENEKWYTFLGGDSTDANNWREEGSGSGGNPDWSNIQNKPENIVTDENYVHTDNNYSNEDKDKLDSIQPGETVTQEWNEQNRSIDMTVGSQTVQQMVLTGIAMKSDIAEAMTDVDNEHFHPVTALPDPADEDPTKRPKENHEYILIEYEQDGTTIKSETHFLFYGSEYHQKSTGGVSLEGYATEDSVNAKIAKMGEFDVATIPQGPTGANEINAVLSNKDRENARVSYVRQSDGTLPNTVNLGVMSGLGEDTFELTTPAYVNLRSAFTIVQNTTTPQEIWNAINHGRALLFRTLAGITKSVLSASASVTVASFICATDSGEGVVVWSVDSNAAYTSVATIFATDAELAALDTRVTGVENQFSTRDYTFADALLLDVDLPHTMPWSEFSAMGFPQSTHQENTVYNVVTFNGNYDKEYPKIRYFNDSQEGAIKTIRYKLDERQSSASSEETLVVEYDIANQTATITTGGTAGINKSHIKAYSPRSVYGVSGKVSEDFDLQVLEEAATHSEVASGVAEAKAYADDKTLAATGWGVVTTGEVLITGITSTSSGNTTIDLSQWGFASVDDYEIFTTVKNNYSAISARAWIEKQSAASAKIIAITGQGDSVAVFYVVVAKGYGAVAYTGEIPTGGTAGQVLTKRSDADGDYGWQTNGAFVTDGDWRYKINPDNTFEAYYYKNGVSLIIQDQSGNFYRSAAQTLNLPTGITDSYDATPLHASVNTSHNNYPCFGTLASVATNQIKYYALSGGSRGASPNYIVTAHVFGTLAE